MLPAVLVVCLLLALTVRSARRVVPVAARPVGLAAGPAGPPREHERRVSRARASAERVEGLEREPSKIEGALRAEAEDLALLTERVPPLFREDLTPDASARALDGGRPGMGLWSSEGGLGVGSHARRAESAMRFPGLLDTLWDTEPFTRDRVRTESFAIRGRRLTLDLALQPDAAETSLGAGRARARHRLARPPPRGPAREHDRQAPDRRGRARAGLHRRGRVRRPGPGVARPEPCVRQGRSGGESNPPQLHLASDARKAGIAFHNEIEGSLARTGEFGDVQDVGAKIAEQAARLAAVLPVFEDGLEGAIDRGTIARARGPARRHLERVLRVGGDLETSQETEDTEPLLDRLRRHPGAGPRDVCPGGPYRLRKNERCDRALDRLVRRNLRRIDGSKIELSPRLAESGPSPASILGGEPGPDLAFRSHDVPSVPLGTRPLRHRPAGRGATAGCGRSRPSQVSSAGARAATRDTRRSCVHA